MYLLPPQEPPSRRKDSFPPGLGDTIDTQCHRVHGFTHASGTRVPYLLERPDQSVACSSGEWGHFPRRPPIRPRRRGSHAAF